MYDATRPHEQDVGTYQRYEKQREQDHVPEEHLAEVHEIEERAQAGPVERILAVRGYPLRVEILLREIPGEAQDDRREESQDPTDPCPGPLASPGGHPELPPEVNNHEGHEDLDAPQVQAVEEVPDGVGVPPVHATQRDHESRGHRYRQCDQRRHAEDVDPRGDVGGLAIG